MFTFTDRAIAEIHKAAEEEPFAGLRVSAESAGCSGFRYGLGFEEEKRDTDVVVTFDGFGVFVDPASLSLLDGAVVDFSEDNGGGFVFNNPAAKAKVKCSCGH